MLYLKPFILLIKKPAKRNIIDLGFSSALLCNYFMNMWSGNADLVSMLPLGERASRVSLFFQSGSSGMERIPRLIKSCLRGGGGDEAVERGWAKPRGLSRWTRAAVCAEAAWLRRQTTGTRDNKKLKRSGKAEGERSWHGRRPFLGWNCICFFGVPFYSHVLLHGGNLVVSYHEYCF